MALTLPSNYISALGQGFAESWLIEISNTGGSGTAAYIRIGTEEVGSGASVYHPLIQNRMSVRESIDLEKGTAKTGNISITCHDGTLANHSQKLSKEILNQGTRYYLNHTVTVKSKVGSISSGDYLTIFTGRLKDVKLNSNHQVVLTIASATPIDFIKIPQYQSSSGNYFPVFYGTGTPTPASTDSSKAFTDGGRVFPVEVDTLNDGQYNCLAHRAITDGRLHYPIKDMFESNGLPLFVPLEDIQNNSFDDYEGATNDTNRNVLFTKLDLSRAYKLRPNNSVTTDSTGASNSTVANLANFYDSDDTTFASMDYDLSSAGSDVLTFKFDNIVREEHTIQECKLKVKWAVSNHSETGQAVITSQLYVTAKIGGSSVRTLITNATGNRSASEDTIDLLASVFGNENGQVPEELIIEFNGTLQVQGGGDSGSADIDMYDAFLEIHTKIEDQNDDTNLNTLANSNSVTSIKQLYTGADGLTKSFDSGSVTNIVDMHRDLLSRFTGRGGSGETPDVNTSNYSALSTARNSWTVQYWTKKEEEVMKLLEKAQFEGGFVFRFRTSNEKPQYIYIPNGTPTADHTIGLEDIRTYDLSMTPIDKLITKRIIKYQRSPINDKHLLEQTSEDTTNSIRTNYNIQTNENIETNTLNMLVGGIGATNTGTGNRNDGFANYYKQINGEPKLITNIEILNAQTSNASNYFYGMEVGDFCTFESSVINNLPVFSGLSTSTVFIVTGITRSPGSLKVTLREI
tara:strand:+ start:2410 stop:4641 length:2232 start_codon:yes stop_codon:yes gene_type:complete